MLKYMNDTELVEAFSIDVLHKHTVRIRIFVIALTGIVLAARSGHTQRAEIPGRDLLGFPLGLVAEPAALPGVLGLGLWNPASAMLPSTARMSLAVAAMNTPADLSVSAQAASVSVRWRGSTVTASLARAAVGGLVRTDSDPLTVGNDVAYSTLVTSLGMAREATSHVTWGVALRARGGQVDFERGAGVSLDGGVVVAHLPLLDARFGASTFLASPWSGGRERATAMASVDARIAGTDSARTARAGIAASTTRGAGNDVFVFGSGRYHMWELRGGVVRTAAYAGTNYRARVAVAVHHAGYTVGIAREGTPSGLPPTYQFVLGSFVR